MNKIVSAVSVFFLFFIITNSIMAQDQNMSQSERDVAIKKIAVGDDTSYLNEILEEAYSTPPNWGVIPFGMTSFGISNGEGGDKSTKK